MWVSGLQLGERMYKRASHLRVKETAEDVYLKLKKTVPATAKIQVNLQEKSLHDFLFGQATVIGVK